MPKDAVPSDPFGDLWVCPRCGRRLLGRNMWHSCGTHTVEGFFAGKGEKAKALFDAFERAIARCGPYIVSPAKTRIAFMARVRFAGVLSAGDRGMTISFALPYPLESPRIGRVDQPTSGWFAHRLRITTPAEIDDELQGWLCDSYHQMGLQERLRRTAADRASIGTSSSIQGASTRSTRRHTTDHDLHSPARFTDGVISSTCGGLSFGYLGRISSGVPFSFRQVLAAGHMKLAVCNSEISSAVS